MRPRRRRPRLRRGLLALGTVGLALAAAAGPWLVVDEVVASPDAILVLASHEDERLPAAWQLALRYPEATVLLSLPAVPTPFNCQECAHRVDRLVSWGLPRHRVEVQPGFVWNSHDELVLAIAAARARGWQAVQVVTSPYHTRRVAGLIGARAGRPPSPRFGVVGASREPIRPWRWWSRRYDGRYVVYELAAMAANGWRYGIWPWEWWTVELGRGPR